MSAQTSYSIEQGKAYQGGMYALGNFEIVSKAVEGANGIEFGTAVSRGTDTEKQIVAGGTAFTGITVRSVDREGTAAGDIKYNETESAAVMREGYMWITLAAGGNPGDAIKYTNATGLIDVGAAGAGETQLDGATLETVTAAGALGLVRLESLATTAGA